MAWTRRKTTFVAGAGVLLVAIAGSLIYKSCRYYAWQVQYPNSMEEWERIVSLLDQVPPQLKIVRAKYSSEGGILGQNGKMLGIGQSIADLMQIAYGINKDRIVFSTELPKGNYDFIANLPGDNLEALRREMENKFNLTVKKEKRYTAVLLLKLKRRNVPGLRPNAKTRAPSSAQWWGDQYHCINVPLSTLVAFLEQRFEMPIVDQTGLAGRFDIDMSWRHSYPETLKQAVLHDLGLELVPGHRQLEMLVVEKTY
jgi:uncharacterized protein (TIGR03435 family)